jgi:hypothetical protein
VASKSGLLHQQQHHSHRSFFSKFLTGYRFGDPVFFCSEVRCPRCRRAVPDVSQAFSFRDEFFTNQHLHFNCKLVNMRSVNFIAILVVVIWSNAAAEGNFPPIWPHPQKLTNGSASLTVDSINFQFSSNFLQRDCVDIYNSFSRFSPVFFPHSPPRKSMVALSAPAITGVSVTILNCSVPLQLGVDESYSLEVDISGGCAASSWTCFAFFFVLFFHRNFSHIWLAETPKSMRQPFMELTMLCRP